MDDEKIQLLMEETGCDRLQAEQALETTREELGEALKLVSRQLRHIVVVKGKFSNPEASQFGLLMVVVNAKTREILRSRAVVSFNPAVYEADLAKDWFEFERSLYGCRLWDGSLQMESLEVERSLAERFRALDGFALEALARDDSPAPSADVSACLKEVFGTTVRLKLTKDVRDLAQFRALDASGTARTKGRRASRPAVSSEDPLVLKISLEEDGAGIAARDLRAGDMVSARIIDARDIAQYLAKLFGAHSDQGPMPVLVPVEAVESGPDGLLARVRFAAGVCGDAAVPVGARIKIVRIAVRNQESHSWWRRFFKT